METTHEPLKRGRGRPRKVQNIIEAISSENDSDSDSASQNSDEDFVLENRVTQYNDGKDKIWKPCHSKISAHIKRIIISFW